MINKTNKSSYLVQRKHLENAGIRVRSLRSTKTCSISETVRV